MRDIQFKSLKETVYAWVEITDKPKTRPGKESIYVNGWKGVQKFWWAFEGTNYLPEVMVQIISHESLHQVVGWVGSYEAGLAIDPLIEGMGGTINYSGLPVALFLDEELK